MGSFPYVIRVFVVRRLTVRRECFFSFSHLLSEGQNRRGQQGDPLEMLIFNLTIHHLWGRVLAKFQEARAIAYADDGYNKVKLRST
jgi:hypothetical protein